MAEELFNVTIFLYLTLCPEIYPTLSEQYFTAEHKMVDDIDDDNNIIFY